MERTNKEKKKQYGQTTTQYQEHSLETKHYLFLMYTHIQWVSKQFFKGKGQSTVRQVDIAR